jgi:hypothetical protein
MKNENKIMADIRHKTSQRPKSVQMAERVSQKNNVQTSRDLLSSKNLSRNPIRNMDIAKSVGISRFGTKPQLAVQNKKSNIPENNLNKPYANPKHIPHPMVKKIQPKPVIENSAKDIKEAAIAEAFQKIAERQKKEKEALKKRTKIIRIIVAILAIVGIGAYFFFVNLPAIAVSYASTKSGFEASFPSFCPNGYARDGYARTEGSSVIMRYKSLVSDNSFNIKQSKSSWDSSAVRNMVDEASAGKFFTTEKNGLTIFSYNNSAAWVNGGILYTITGDATLKTDEIQQIALSF